jgi:hypothetical protein
MFVYVPEAYLATFKFLCYDAAMPRSQATVLAPTFDTNVWYAVFEHSAGTALVHYLQLRPNLVRRSMCFSAAPLCLVHSTFIQAIYGYATVRGLYVKYGKAIHDTRETCVVELRTARRTTDRYGAACFLTEIIIYFYCLGYYSVTYVTCFISECFLP